MNATLLFRKQVRKKASACYRNYSTSFAVCGGDVASQTRNLANCFFVRRANFSLVKRKYNCSRVARHKQHITFIYLHKCDAAGIHTHVLSSIDRIACAATSCIPAITFLMRCTLAELPSHDLLINTLLHNQVARTGSDDTMSVQRCTDIGLIHRLLTIGERSYGRSAVFTSTQS